jgi:hypothetical protein
MNTAWPVSWLIKNGVGSSNMSQETRSDAAEVVSVTDAPAAVTEADDTIVLPPLTPEVLDRIQRGDIPVS